MTDQEGLSTSVPMRVTRGAQSAAPAELVRQSNKSKAEAQRFNAENNAIKKKATEAAETVQKIQDRSVEVISTLLESEPYRY